ncbi:hypothetical protein Tco_1060112 [Tanacetum coccineum]
MNSTSYLPPDTKSLEGHVSPPEWCHVACQPSPEPPPDHRSTVVVNGGGRRSNGLLTRPSSHRLTASQRRATTRSDMGSWAFRIGYQRSGQMVATAATWQPSGTTWQHVAPRSS